MDLNMWVRFLKADMEEVSITLIMEILTLDSGKMISSVDRGFIYI